MPEYLAAPLVRAAQGLFWSAPTLLVGLLIAGVLRYYLGNEGTRRLFGGDSLRSLPQSWLVGMLLPVCSIGVLPVLRQMYRAGVRPGAMTAFALSAPLFNPLSLLYGLTLSRPLVILSFAFASLVLVTALGWIWDRRVGRRGARGEEQEAGEAKGEQARDRVAPIRSDGEGPEPAVSGVRRLVALAWLGGRELAGPSGGYALVAVAGLAFLGLVLPHGVLQAAVEQQDPLSPLRMAAVAVPVYATPMLAMSQLGMMFQHANSPGAALVLLLLGTGMNLATLLWLGRRYGARATALWFTALMVLVLGAAYAVDRPLIPVGVEPAGHTHAFDIYTSPFAGGSSEGVGWSTFRATVARQAGWAEAVALAGVLLWLLLGAAVRWFDRRDAILHWLRAGGEGEGRGGSAEGWDREVPAPVLGITAMLALIALSVVACFAYYPAAEECLEEMRIVRTDALSAARGGRIDEATAAIEQWEDWSRRLEVGTFLRSGRITPYQRMQGYLLRKYLEHLEHELEEEPRDEAEIGRLVMKLSQTSTRLRRAYDDPAP